MKFLLIGSIHHKNRIAIENMSKELNWTYKEGNINDINNFDIIYSPSFPIDASL